jgi:hypothetical protein
MNSAEKQLRAADERVQDAEARYTTAATEWRQAQAEADALDGETQRRVYDAATAGETVDVTDDRKRLAELRERLAMMVPVEAALRDGLRRAREDRDRLTAELFPDLAAGVARDGEKILRSRGEIMARYEAELAPLERAERELHTRWEAMTKTLPAPLRPPSLTADLEPVIPEPHAGLGGYVAEPHWPMWARAIVNQSREIAADATERLRIQNMPMGA